MFCTTNRPVFVLLRKHEPQNKHVKKRRHKLSKLLQVSVIASCLYVIRVSLLWRRFFYVRVRVIFQFIASKMDGKVTMCDSRIASCHCRHTSFQSFELLYYIGSRTFKIISFGMSERLQTTKTYSTDST